MRFPRDTDGLFVGGFRASATVGELNDDAGDTASEDVWRRTNKIDYVLSILVVCLRSAHAIESFLVTLVYPSISLLRNEQCIN